MPYTVSPNGNHRSRRYRVNRRSCGMKLLRVWVPDPSAPRFREEARRKANILRGCPEQEEALDFIEENF
ncbi:antitoxin MazE-like protein [Skermanella aerolata]